MTEHERRLDNTVRELIVAVGVLKSIITEDSGRYKGAGYFGQITELESALNYANRFFDAPIASRES